MHHLYILYSDDSASREATCTGRFAVNVNLELYIVKKVMRKLMQVLQDQVHFSSNLKWKLFWNSVSNSTVHYNRKLFEVNSIEGDLFRCVFLLNNWTLSSSSIRFLHLRCVKSKMFIHFVTLSTHSLWVIIHDSWS